MYQLNEKKQLLTQHAEQLLEKIKELSLRVSELESGKRELVQTLAESRSVHAELQARSAALEIDLAKREQQLIQAEKELASAGENARENSRHTEAAAALRQQELQELREKLKRQKTKKRTIEQQGLLKVSALENQLAVGQCVNEKLRGEFQECANERDFFRQRLSE